MRLNWDDPSLLGMIYTANCAQVLFHMDTANPHMWCTVLSAHVAAGTATSHCSHYFEMFRHSSPAQGPLTVLPGSLGNISTALLAFLALLSS